MNRIYNVIWSKTKKCYVVVSEIVKSGGGKVKSINTDKSYARVGTVMAVAALLVGANVPTVVAAEDTSKAMVINGIYGTYITGEGQASIGSTLYNYENPGNDGALDGTKTTQGGYPLYTNHRLNGLRIGRNSSIQDGTSNIHSGMAIGDYTKATGGLSIAMGNYAQATNASSMAIGTATLSSGFNSLAMMRQSAAKGDFSTAIGTASWANAKGSFAMGYSATAKGEQSIAIGAAETITIPGSSSISTTPSAKYNAAGNTVTEGDRSLAFGTKARTGVGAHDSMAFGSNSITAGVNAVAMGNSAQATDADAFAFGNTSQAKGSSSIAMGKTAEASKENAIALGGLSKAKDVNAIAIGGKAEASKEGTMAIGTGAKADSISAVAIGIESEVTGENSMAIGAKAVAETKNSLALGAGTEIRGTLVNTYSAFTNEMNPAASGVVAVANVGTERRIINVAGGQNDTDAANVKQLRYVNNNLAQTIAGSTYTGYEANGSTYKAPDFDIKKTTYHTVKEAVEAAQTNFFSAKGVSTDANYDNKGATGTNSTAAGVRASAAGNYGTALGADATATNEKGTALGYKAKVTADNGVALGSGSVASTAAGVAGYDVSVADSRANKYTALTGAVATSTLGAVSVGETSSTGTQTRQITNVAAGKNDSDAVNVAQLRNINLKIAGNTGTNDVLLDNQTLAVKGDNKYVTSSVTGQTITVGLTTDTKNKIDNAADKDLSNITNVAKKNITALGTIVAAGNNVTIGAPTVDATTGQKTYTINAMDTKVTLGTSGLMTLTGGTPDATGVRTYTVDVDPTKVAKSDLTNITNGGKTIIQQEAQKAVKVVAGQNTTVTEGTDGTYKTYAVNVDAPDYQLVQNSAATDKAYTVTSNKVDLTVQDSKNPANKKTVTIKDIASKTELDKLDDRAVKYDLDSATNKADKSKVTYEGPAYTNKTGGTHVTNVAYATGTDGSEAVNVDYLTDKIKDSSDALINKGLKFDANVGGVKTNKLGSTVKVQGEGAEADANYSGKNIKTFIGQDTAGNTTIDVKMNKNLEVETITATGPAGKDGKIGINGKDGVTTNISITRDGQPGVDGAAGTTTTRIVYEKPDGTKEEVATLNDGLKFKGDMGATSNVKLNKQVDVNGGVTNAADLATGNNIGVTSAAVDANGNAKLQLQLAKDITGLKSVTASDTVKAGTATVGKQTVNDNKGTAQTGSFVTGLGNTSWNMADPAFVSGRAATEDQLKTVSDAVKAANAGATDYRLVENDAATDKAYTVTSNKVDLNVKDEKSGTTKTVTIKDIASKTELDKLNDRAVKYDLDKSGAVDKTKVTYEGPTYNNKTGGTHVTNVAYATGTDGSEAVNVDYLTDKIKDSSDALINKGLKFDANVGGVQTNKLGSTVTVKGEGTAADAKYSGENIKTFIDQDKSGNTTINVKMNKDIIADSIKVNKDGRDGKDGVSITGPTGVAGQDGNNGKVGIAGADGKDAVSISGKDGVGHIGLTGPAGTNGINGTNGIDMTVKNGYDDATKGVKGEKGVDGVDGITRIVYIDKTGEHQVATMDDGMLYGGDSGTVIKKKLNNQVNVKGGITDPTKFTADDNIGVVSDGTDTLKVRLAKDLKGLNTVTAAKTVKAGTATVGNQEVTKADGTKETGNYVTGLDNKTWDADNIVTGRAATEDQLKEALSSQANAGLKFDANVGGTKTNKLGSTVIVKGEGTAADAKYSGENIKTFIDQDKSGNTTINVKMNKDIVADSIKVNKDGRDGKDGVSITGPTGAAGTDGNNGKVGITGADGKDAVSISGKDGVGHIGLTGPAGTNGKDGSNGIDMSVKNGYDDPTKGVKGEKGVDGVDGITRIVYTDKTGEHQVATMDDGMLYGGDSGTVIKKKLNNQVNVKGGVTDATKLSAEDNIGVISDGTDTLMLRLAKDLKGLNSATFNNGTNGNTVINGGGMTINNAAGNPLTSITKDGVTITDGPSMTKDGIDAGSKKITNVADGTIGAGSKDAVNGGQLHSAVEGLKTKGFGLTAEDGNSVKKPLGDTVTVKGDGTNITTSVDNGAVKVALSRDLNVDTVTANTVTTGDTKMDTNGVTIKDGANEAVKLTKDGLQINDGADKAVTINKDGLTIENGPKVTKDGIDAGDNKITNVADGTIGAGSKDAVNGGQLHSAVEDLKAKGFGLKAEDGQSVKKPLGEVIDLKGDGNIKTSVDGTAIKMSLNDTITLGTDPAKQVKIDGTTGTISAANTVKAGDAVVGKQEVTKADGTKETGNYVTGLDNKTWNPNDPKAVSGRAATEDQLKVLNDDFNEKVKNGRVFQGDQAGNDGKVVKGLGDTVNIKGGADVTRLSDNNIAVLKNAAGDGYDIKLAKDLNLKDGSTSYTKVVPGAGPTPGYTVDTRVDGGGITITPSINGTPVPGRTVTLTENGLNNGNNTITNVAPGVNGTDAVNVNQLRNAVSSVDGKIADVGAASAAMAGLKPLQYDPLEPTQVMAAIGNYKGSTAAAIGVAHYTNESTMLHMGLSLGAHDNMVNAGVSYKFGTSDAKKAIPERYKAGPISSAYVMQDEVTALKAENLRMKQRDEELSAKYEQVQRDNEEMKAQIAMLMKQAGLTK